MRGTIACLLATVCLAGMTQARAQGEDAGAWMRTIASEPYRYGGEMQGSLLGLAERPMHLSLGLEGPAPDGHLRGAAMLFDAQRRLVAVGLVSGGFRPGYSAGTASCTLRLALPAGSVTLAGTCTRDALSGAIRARPQRPALLARLIGWWGDRSTTGEYWLTPASFDPPA